MGSTLETVNDGLGTFSQLASPIGQAASGVNALANLVFTPIQLAQQRRERKLKEMELGDIMKTSDLERKALSLEIEDKKNKMKWAADLRKYLRS